MDRALEIWTEEGLPPLKLREPWYGYTLGPWPSELVQEAELAIRGDYYETGKKLEEKRISIKPPSKSVTKAVQENLRKELPRVQGGSNL
jgi:hypothetical protein